MRIARSAWRKIIVTGVAVGGFVFLYETTMLDSKYGSHPPLLAQSETPAPGARLPFTATAYCKGLLTTSGVAAQKGVAAADPQLLPVGSVVQIESGEGQHDGIYTVLDTGPAVQGRRLDIYIWNCNEALQFGRRSILMTVLRLGWDPRATMPGFMERFLKRRQPEAPPLPSRPLPMIPVGEQD